MTKEETSKIVFIIMSTFTTAYKNTNAEKTAALITAWNAVMEDYSYAEVEQGLYIYMSTDTSGFPPSPGQVIDKIKAAHPQEREIDALEAWAIVEKAVCNASYDYNEQFLKLPPLCQKAVGSPDILREWAVMDIDKFQTVEQSHFIRVYDTVKKRQKEHERLPRKVRELIEATVDQMPRLPEIKQPEPESEDREEERVSPEVVSERIEQLKREFAQCERDRRLAV